VYQVLERETKGTGFMAMFEKEKKTKKAERIHRRLLEASDCLSCKQS